MYLWQPLLAALKQFTLRFGSNTASPLSFPPAIKKEKKNLNTHFWKAGDKSITSSQMWILPDFEVNLLSHP